VDHLERGHKRGHRRRKEAATTEKTLAASPPSDSGDQNLDRPVINTSDCTGKPTASRRGQPSNLYTTMPPPHFMTVSDRRKEMY